MLVTRLGSVVAVVLLTSCSGQTSRPHEERDAAPAAGADADALVSLPPARAPELPGTAERDRDGNRLDDVLDQRLLAARANPTALAERVEVQVVLNRPLRSAELAEFRARGGSVEHVFQQLRYGLIGALPLGKVESVGRLWGDSLHLLAAPSEVVPFLDEATRNGRARVVWANGFAGSASGFSGRADIAIGIVDSGVDAAHPDLAGRQVAWADYTNEAPTPRDFSGHGTHVASIALGSGVAFGSSNGTLKLTQDGNLQGAPAGSASGVAMHTPAYFGGSTQLQVSAQARFLGAGPGTLVVARAADGGGGLTDFGSASGGSPLAIASASDSSGAAQFLPLLLQSSPPAITRFAVSSSVSGYPGVGDGFGAFRGVAPDCNWYGARVLTDAGLGSSFAIARALDDMVSGRKTNNVKIINMSLGVSGGGTDTLLRALVNTAVELGVVIVAAAGNDGPSTAIGDPGRAGKAITVGATNDRNQLTEYTSIGVPPPLDDDEDTKPDVLAPGGSEYLSAILAADSGTTDGQSATLGDLVANDYSGRLGTSMATPFVSGSVALLIDALQSSGTSWSFDSSAHSLLVKMLLLASATELNAAREGASSSPTLGRAVASKDRFEGYGIINPDAAIEALLRPFASPLSGSVSNTPPARLEWERRAWGRKLELVNGATVLLNLAVPSDADLDLYLYSSTPGTNGNPLRRAASAQAGSGVDETINYVSSVSETAYVFVKRVSGFGSFSLTGSAVSHCGDGDVDAGELCDPAAAGSSTCCTATCTPLADGSGCTDDDKCTTADVCQAGQCVGAAVVCSAKDQCHAAGQCDAATGVCSEPQKVNGSACSDGSACTGVDTCQAGACQGASPVVCGAPDDCHQAGVCAPANGTCQYVPKPNGSACGGGGQCQAGACVLPPMGGAGGGGAGGGGAGGGGAGGGGAGGTAGGGAGGIAGVGGVGGAGVGGVGGAGVGGVGSTGGGIGGGPAVGGDGGAGAGGDGGAGAGADSLGGAAQGGAALAGAAGGSSRPRNPEPEGGASGVEPADGGAATQGGAQAFGASRTASGCSCRVTGEPRGGSVPAWLLGLLAAGVWRARRRA